MQTQGQSVSIHEATLTGDRANLFTQCADRFNAMWQVPFLRRKTARAVLLLTIAAICLIRAWIGLTGSSLFTHDAFMLFDGAWRMLNGQRPHTDFYSHVGILSYLPTLVGLWISHGTAAGFGYGEALVGFLLGVWAYVLGRRRLSDAALALMCLGVVLMATASFSLGFVPLSLSPGMTYNRHGYAMIALILIEAFTDSRRTQARDDFWGGISSGVAVGLLLFLKITYFGAALFLLAVLLPCRTQIRLRWRGLILGFAGTCLLCCAYFRFNMMPLINDLRMIAGGKHIRIRWYILDGIFQDAGLALAFAIAAALLMMSENNWRSARAILIAALAVCLTGILIIFGNYEQNGFPLAVFLAIVIIDAINRRISAQPNLFRTAVLVVGSAFIVGSLFSGGLGLSYGFVQKFLRKADTQSFDAPNLKGFTVTYDEPNYPIVFNEGFALIRKNLRPGDTLMSLDFCNPFSYGLGLKPARGGATVLQYKTTFNDAHRPSAEWLFGSANLVIAPNRYSADSRFPDDNEDTLRIYGPYLRRHFHVIAETRIWRLYRRNSDDSK